jgi:hypothetical protein
MSKDRKLIPNCFRKTETNTGKVRLPRLVEISHVHFVI